MSFSSISITNIRGLKLKVMPKICQNPKRRVFTSKKRRGGFWTFALGFILGALALFGLALFATLRNM